MDQSSNSGNGERRRRRRRRRTSRRPNGNGAPQSNGAPEQAKSGGQGRKGRWGRREDPRPAVALPRSARVPRRRLAVHPSRGKVASGAARRRRMSRAEMDALADYLNRMPDQLVAQLYSGLGGQPGRVPGKDRMIQLTVRAVAQGNRLSALLKSLHQRDRQALAILLQCGALAHHEEFHHELILSLGGSDREWNKVLTNLGDKGLVAATDEQNGHFFYLVPEPLIDHLLEHLREDLVLPGFDNEDVKVVDGRPFCPPLDFSITSLLTYIDQHPPRLTQRHEIFKVHKEEMDKFFGQIWPVNSDLFSFHIEFLMTQGMVELRGDRLSVNRAVVEEYLHLDPEDQRDLIFAGLDQRFPLSEWVFWAVHDVGGAWVPERPLQALYRRWRRGEEWRLRYHSENWAAPRQATRDGFTFTPLVNTGMLELGQWGQEKFYRLTQRTLRLLEPPEDEGFTQFYLTPNFEVMAPAGMAPALFFRIGELAELTACDRANTYKITEVTIEQALEKGWRRDDLLEFLRDNSQIGLPENVEHTLRGWMGHHGDVEYHDVMLLTVHRAQIRKIESNRFIRPFLLHRFVPGMYAVDRTRMAELNVLLAEHGFSPAGRVRQYPDDPQQVDARERLLNQVTEARTQREDLIQKNHAADALPEILCTVPGSGQPMRQKKRRREQLPPRRSPREVRELAERSVTGGYHIEMIYVTRDEQRKHLRVSPERVATNARGQQVLVGTDLAAEQRLSYQLVQIERMALYKPRR